MSNNQNGSRASRSNNMTYKQPTLLFLTKVIHQEAAICQIEYQSTQISRAHVRRTKLVKMKDRHERRARVIFYSDHVNKVVTDSSVLIASTRGWKKQVSSYRVKLANKTILLHLPATETNFKTQQCSQPLLVVRNFIGLSEKPL